MEDNGGSKLTVNLKCCVENQSDLFYGNLDGFTNKLFKSITILGRNLNKNSIALINYLGNKLIILHVFTCTQLYIYICTRMYITLLSSVHDCICMNTTPIQLGNCPCSCSACQEGSHCYENPCAGEDDYG